MNFCFKFPAVKGVQAKKEYYIAMVPMKMLNKIFQEDEEVVLPEYRAQRRLNENRIPEICKYIVENEESYVFSALAASIDGDFTFIEIDESGLGILEVDMSSRFLINDGQHRKAAILEAIKEKKELGEETISVVFYEDKGLARSQQMFTDLNKHAVKTSNSIAELYDSRDPLAVITRNVISKISFFNEYVDKEKDNLGKYSSALFTLNTFYNANKRIVGKTRCDNKAEEFLTTYWNYIVTNMVPWKEMVSKELSKTELREKYIATQAVVIQAFGRVGASVYENKEYLTEDVFSKLKNINWKRSNERWKQRVIRNDGRMINNSLAIMLTSNEIKKILDLKLNGEELEAENKIN